MIRQWSFILVVCFAMVGLSSQKVASHADKAKWQVSVSGYFQVMGSTAEQNFSLPNSKLFIDGYSGERLCCRVEFRPAVGNPLVKAYVGYTLNPALTVIFGQLSNPIKYVEPQPEEQVFVRYALYERYVANSDDIGLAVTGKFDLLKYYACLINGTGRNVPDNNEAKDVAIYCSYEPFGFIKLEAAGQTGKQPAGLRQASFARCSFFPHPSLELQLAVMGRSDLDDSGWYASGFYIFRTMRFLGRVHKTSNDQAPEWTVGLQTGQTFKFAVNAMVGHQRQPELAAFIQIFVK